MKKKKKLGSYFYATEREMRVLTRAGHVPTASRYYKGMRHDNRPRCEVCGAEFCIPLWGNGDPATTRNDWEMRLPGKGGWRSVMLCKDVVIKEVIE